MNPKYTVIFNYYEQLFSSLEGAARRSVPPGDVKETISQLCQISDLILKVFQIEKERKQLNIQGTPVTAQQSQPAQQPPLFTGRDRI